MMRYGILWHSISRRVEMFQQQCERGCDFSRGTVPKDGIVCGIFICQLTGKELVAVLTDRIVSALSVSKRMSGHHSLCIIRHATAHCFGSIGYERFTPVACLFSNHSSEVAQSVANPNSVGPSERLCFEIRFPSVSWEGQSNRDSPSALKPPVRRRTIA
ncbi:hypothetical protein ARMGADRAFT_63012 [Armillaria gallica]|uniref:Uncharacterized protein n=1 Tax=Armillaria gallica TaxID=47427 RepID=A0A2H3DV51_ARMGA|nr:hypothetical protein ARMGADRAFT_63012 [Armillaria gallica]